MNIHRQRLDPSKASFPKMSGAICSNRFARGKSTTSFITTASSKRKNGSRCTKSIRPRATMKIAARFTKSFEAAAAKIKSKRVHVIGLGCGGGQKDTRLLKLLKARGKEIFYTPCDVSTAMVLVARQTALAVLPEKNCFPFVCDLATADDLPAIFDRQRRQAARTRHFLRHDSEFRAAGYFAKTRVAGSAKRFSAVQRQPCAGKKLRRRREKNSAAIRQCADARLAADISARSGS